MGGRTGGGGGTGSSITEYTIHASFTEVDFPVGTPVSIFEGFAAPATKTLDAYSSVVGLAKSAVDGIVEAQKMVHVLNAPSPAAAASLSIGKTIAGIVKKKFDEES